MHAPLLAHGATVDVDAGQPQHQGVHRLDRAGGRSGGLGQDLPAARELDPPGAVGEEADVTDADQAVGDDMEEEAADELGRLQLHHLHTIAVGVVLPTESDATVIEAEDALVGEGHAVGIAAQVLEDLLGAGEGAFGVHDPVRLAELVEPRSEGAGVGEGGSRSGEDERARVERAPERVEVFAPEDLGEGADGEEKAGRGGEPARAVGGEGAPRDDTVEVEVLRQILPPGVQDGRDAEIAAEMAGIAAEGGEGVGGGVEEEGVEELWQRWPVSANGRLCHGEGAHGRGVCLRRGLMLLTLMVLQGLPAAVVLAPVVFPTAMQIGIHPVHFNIVLTAAVGIGLFLPPIGVGLLMALRFANISVG